MFETAELGRKLSKAEYDEREPLLREQLLKVQRELASAPFPVLILLNGVDGAGKGETANLLNEWLDARHLETHAFDGPSQDEAERPEFWRYWMRLPARGKIGIYIGNWYTQPIVQQVMGAGDDARFSSQLAKIRGFEKTLADDGALIIKFWFHLGKKQQKLRLKNLEANPETAWRVTKQDWRRFKVYDKFRAVCERSLRDSSTAEAPWTVIEGADERYRAVAVAQHILERVQEHLALQKARAEVREQLSTSSSPAADPLTVLDLVDLSAKLDKADYGRELERLQGRLNKLSRKVKKQGLSCIIVFEGWDAAGKGGAIRRLIRSLDARQFRVIPIAAPSAEERAYHYLWRFWRHIPRPGRFTIYDRSWYGRVLVERVENFATRLEWQRAFEEINDFEAQLVDANTVLVKFWLHFSKEEQLRRFKEREQTPYKAHKIGPEDYRNREKWPAYEAAADEMVCRTNTEMAPWKLIAAEQKQFARIEVLRAVCDAVEARLK